jgi:histidine ammonia-lyase
MQIQIDGEHLTIEDLHRLVLGAAEAELSAASREKMKASREVIERLAGGDSAAYGVNTGFGKMAATRISPDEIRQLQLNLVRSHACGVGAPLREPATRAMLALRANAIAKGFSGVRPILAETLIAMLNRRVHPVIPSQGSAGASGDLAPLAHLAQAAIGEGQAVFQGRVMPGHDAMRAAGIVPLALEAKEGLALLNGTQAMLAVLTLALHDAEIAADTADVAARQSGGIRRAHHAGSAARRSGDYGAQYRAAESRQRNPRVSPFARLGPARTGPIQFALRATGTWRRSRRAGADSQDGHNRDEQRHR